MSRSVSPRTSISIRSCCCRWPICSASFRRLPPPRSITQSQDAASPGAYSGPRSFPTPPVFCRSSLRSDRRRLCPRAFRARLRPRRRGAGRDLLVALRQTLIVPERHKVRICSQKNESAPRIFPESNVKRVLLRRRARNILHHFRQANHACCS